MKIAKETWIILAIGLADLATTILFIRYHGAQEANPLFKRYWEMGLAIFIGAKIALLVGPLSVLEWARQRRPRFVSWALRAAICAYLAMYVGGYIHLNHPAVRDADLSDIGSPAIHLQPRLAGHIRPVVQAVKQSSSTVRGNEEAVTVY